MLHIDVEMSEARRRVGALVVEIDPVTAGRLDIVGYRPRELGVELPLLVLLVREVGVVARHDRHVPDRRFEPVAAKPRGLGEVLVVDAGRQRVEQPLPARQRDHRALAHDLARTDHVQAADRGDVAVRLHRVGEKAQPVDVRDAREIGEGDDLRILRALRRDLVADAERMPELPQVVVVHGRVQARRCRVR